MTNVELCETEADLAHRINVQGPLACARAAGKIGAKFVYFSTEYVFDGRSGPYTEESPVNPINVYGRSKADAETALALTHPSALIIRTTVVYGFDRQGKNFGFAGGAVFQSQQFHAGLKKLRRAMRLARLMAEHQPACPPIRSPARPTTRTWRRPRSA